jgi:hypothetical protein
MHSGMISSFSTSSLDRMRVMVAFSQRRLSPARILVVEVF